VADLAYDSLVLHLFGSWGFAMSMLWWMGSFITLTAFMHSCRRSVQPGWMHTSVPVCMVLSLKHAVLITCAAVDAELTLVGPPQTVADCSFVALICMFFFKCFAMINCLSFLIPLTAYYIYQDVHVVHAIWKPPAA